MLRFNDDAGPAGSVSSYSPAPRPPLNRTRREGVFVPWCYVLADAAVSGTLACRTGYTLAKSLVERRAESGVAWFLIDDLSRMSRGTIEVEIDPAEAVQAHRPACQARRHAPRRRARQGRGGGPATGSEAGATQGTPASRPAAEREERQGEGCGRGAHAPPRPPAERRRRRRPGAQGPRG